MTVNAKVGDSLLDVAKDNDVDLEGNCMNVALVILKQQRHHSTNCVDFIACSIVLYSTSNIIYNDFHHWEML